MSNKIDYQQQLEKAKIVMSGMEVVPYTVARHIIQTLMEEKVNEAVDSVSNAIQEYVQAVKMLKDN